jgi:neopullulanase
MPGELAHSDFRTPEWVKHAVFYQIFPERFANGSTANDPENVQPWGTTPTPKNYMGGDLHGIISRLDYLQDLGITALYLNPIFHALSNHKYDTYDYFRIDPHLGDMATFRELIDQAHRRGMRVILDGVFNHCGRGFFAFVNVLENGGESPYRNWFYIEDLPLHPYNDKKPANYAGWWSLRSLPKLNVGHPPTRRYILDVARYWLEQGADGWRLDVPNEIEDTAFWREFRQVVKQANPDAYIVGEIWEDATRWLDGTQFDAVMNYIWRDLCRDFFAHDVLKPSAFAQGLDMLQQRYPEEAMLAQLNLFGSHGALPHRGARRCGTHVCGNPVSDDVSGRAMHLLR